jgi:integrase/recombinase XerD
LSFELTEGAFVRHTTNSHDTRIREEERADMSAAVDFRDRVATAVAAYQPKPRRPRAHVGRAKTLSAEQIDHLLRHIQATAREPLRDYAIILLSFKAGLRACEIVGLNWRDVLDVTGKIAGTLEVPDGIAKNGQGRSIPMHPVLQAALEHLLRYQRSCVPLQPTGQRDPVITSLDGGRLSSNALQQYLRRLYIRAGLQGCSSHSGRRTLLTKLARTANAHGCSLYDVQDIAGHAGIESTEPYVEPGFNVAKMMRAV